MKIEITYDNGSVTTITGPDTPGRAIAILETFEVKESRPFRKGDHVKCNRPKIRSNLGRTAMVTRVLDDRLTVEWDDALGTAVTIPAERFDLV